MTDQADWERGVIPGTFQITGSGVKLVAISSTAVPMRSSTLIKTVFVKARKVNVATLYLGPAGVTADENVNTGGLQLDPGDMIVFADTDLADIFVNGTAGDGVSYAWWA